MKALRSAGVILIIGAVLFAIGSFSPSIGVFWESDEAGKLQLLQEGKSLWQITHLLWITGALVTIVGLGLVTYHLRRTQISMLAFLGFIAVALGAAIGVWHLYLRAVDSTAFVQGGLPDWHYGVYTVLTLLGLAIYGFVYLRAGLPRWLGYVTIGGAALAFVGFVALQMVWPPLSYYVLTFLAGVVLVRLKE
jgi:hypothetical protein